MTQCERVLEAMRRRGEITAAAAAYELGVMRLSARILDLRAAGYRIETENRTAKNRYGDWTTFAVYRLIEDDKQTEGDLQRV